MHSIWRTWLCGLSHELNALSSNKGYYTDFTYKFRNAYPKPLLWRYNPPPSVNCKRCITIWKVDKIADWPVTSRWGCELAFLSPFLKLTFVVKQNIFLQFDYGLFQLFIARFGWASIAKTVWQSFISCSCKYHNGHIRWSRWSWGKHFTGTWLDRGEISLCYLCFFSFQWSLLPNTAVP